PDLAAVGDELPQQPGVLVVHVGDLLLAEQADFLSGLAYWCFRHHGAPGESPAPGGDGQLIKGVVGSWPLRDLKWRLVERPAIAESGGLRRCPRVLRAAPAGRGTIPGLTTLATWGATLAA